MSLGCRQDLGGNGGKRGVGVVFPSPSGPGGAPFGETLPRNPTFGISKPVGTRRRALRGNPHQKSDFWDFQALWQPHSVPVWQPHRAVRAAGGRRAGGRANSDPTGVHPHTHTHTQNCYPPAGGDKTPRGNEGGKGG